MFDDNFYRVVKFVQELLLDMGDKSSISPALIAGKIVLVVNMQPSWGIGLDRDAVTDELIRRFSLWIGKDTTLENAAGHEAWLDSSRKSDWRYWRRYREWIERDLSWKAVDALDRSSDRILGLLEDPQRQGNWDRRGLVVGHVQSGKTSNYTGLICKAADAGYKVVIVLAGLHNNLRSQTQIRLEEGFLGYDTNAHEDSRNILGVGEFDSDPDIHPNCATNRSEKGDFNKRVANHLAVSPEQRPWLFVVKKNKTSLTHLLRWIQNHVADSSGPNIDEGAATLDGLPRVRKRVTKLPALIIDDEADHASVDTQELVVTEDGIADDEHQPTTINRLIRRILFSFSRSAYVGYTATPFANIFIHERGITKEEGPDIFPAAFIHNLATPSNYVGPARIFGLNTQFGRAGGLPLIREVHTDELTAPDGSWMPPKHRNGHLPVFRGKRCLPPSLVQAIDSFVIACAVRRIRGQEAEHCSMLIHVTRFKSVQGEVYSQVDEHLSQMRQRLIRGIDCAATFARLRELWETDFLDTTHAVSNYDYGQGEVGPITWPEIESVLPDVISDIQTRIINGTAKDALDYEEQKEKGLKVIAIGGDKLSRGLTLEGLCTSYFLRASRMYDTLMQMGRWFGYRPGYLDLCRLYTTADLIEWFGHITDAAEELRQEFDLMVDAGATPREYGLKVQSHPILMVTSRLKMRAARNLMLSFSGQLLETVVFFKESSRLGKNFLAAQRFVVGLGTPHEINPERCRAGKADTWSGYLWRGVESGEVCSFLLGYESHPAAYKVNSAMLAEFTRSMSTIGELTRWTVAIVGSSSGNVFSITPTIKIGMNKRTGNKGTSDDGVFDRYSIGRLLDPKDESIHLSDEEWSAALDITRAARNPDPARLVDASIPDTPNGPSIRRVLGFGNATVPASPERGLLILYLLDPTRAEVWSDTDAKEIPPVVGFGISFPGSNSGVKVEYKVNNVLWEQEYGASE